MIKLKYVIFMRDNENDNEVCPLPDVWEELESVEIEEVCFTNPSEPFQRVHLPTVQRIKFEGLESNDDFGIRAVGITSREVLATLQSARNLKWWNSDYSLIMNGDHWDYHRNMLTSLKFVAGFFRSSSSNYLISLLRMIHSYQFPNVTKVSIVGADKHEVWLTDVYQAVMKNCCPSEMDLYGQIVPKTLIKHGLPKKLKKLYWRCYSVVNTDEVKALQPMLLQIPERHIEIKHVTGKPLNDFTNCSWP
jgi:hypothetical protein